MMSRKQTGRNNAAKKLQLSKARLDELVEEALVDAYGESEQATGFYTIWKMILSCRSKRKSLA
jgi:exonuclease III